MARPSRRLLGQTPERAKLEELMEVMRTYFLMLLQIFNNDINQIDDDMAACLMDVIMSEQT